MNGEAILENFDEIIAEQDEVVAEQNLDGDIPEGFELRPDGVYRVIVHGSGPKKWDEWVKVCSPLRVVALTRDGEGSEWGRQLEWTDLDDRSHQWAMPMGLLSGDGSEYREHLLREGLRIEPSRQAREGLHTYISTCEPAARATSVVRLGWHGKNFVLPDAVYGAQSAGERIILQTPQPIEHALRQKGTLEGWKEQIGSRCRGNSRLIFGVSFSFTPPLLELVGEESGGAHYVGGSSIGKTSVLEVSGSVCGGGGLIGYKRQWRATANGLEAVLAAHCDLPINLDDISQCSGKEVGETAYLITNGQGKSRSRRDGTARATLKWRTGLLSTGEYSLTDRIAEDGHRRATAGQAIRVLDVPADAGAGKGCFENLHGEKDGDTFSRKLKAAAKREYGTPLRTYLKKLTENPSEYAGWVRKVSAEFVKDLEIPGFDGQVQRALGRFALIAAAGELATEMGITGWATGDAIAAVAKCFEAWLDRRGSAGPAEIAVGVAQIRKFFEQHAESRFSDAKSTIESERPVINRVGFKYRELDGWHFLVLPESWREELCKGLDARTMAKELDRLRLLIPAPDGKPQRPETIPALDNHKIRVYHFTPAILGEEENDDRTTTPAAAQ